MTALGILSGVKLPVIVRVSVFMISASSVGAGLTAVIRVLAENDLHTFEIAFFRNLFAFLIVIPFLRPLRLSSLRVHRPGRIFASSVVQILAIFTFFYAVAFVPLAELMAISFTEPLFLTIGAALFLGETVRARRWTAVAVGFLGVIIIVQPGTSAFQPAALVAIGAAMLYAGVGLLMKNLSERDSPVTILLYQNLFLMLLSLVPVLFVWRNPLLHEWPMLVLLGVLGVGVWLLFIKAVQIADASTVAPFVFTRLPMAALFGYLVFAEVPTIWTWIGGVIICASTVYIAHRESAAARHAAADLS